jgi:aldehyde:ferredoxin oxidoreductase
MKRQRTVAVMDIANEVDGFPFHYFSEQNFEAVEGINGTAAELDKYHQGTCSTYAFACKLAT